MNIRTNNSPITIYIQHPIPIPAPGDKNKVAMKPLKLTKKVRIVIFLEVTLPYVLFVGAKEDAQAAQTGGTSR